MEKPHRKSNRFGGLLGQRARQKVTIHKKQTQTTTGKSANAGGSDTEKGADNKSREITTEPKSLGPRNNPIKEKTKKNPQGYHQSGKKNPKEKNTHPYNLCGLVRGKNLPLEGQQDPTVAGSPVGNTGKVLVQLGILALVFSFAHSLQICALTIGGEIKTPQFNNEFQPIAAKNQGGGKGERKTARFLRNRKGTHHST